MQPQSSEHIGRKYQRDFYKLLVRDVPLRFCAVASGLKSRGFSEKYAAAGPMKNQGIEYWLAKAT
jgi:hypothetical protein